MWISIVTLGIISLVQLLVVVRTGSSLLLLGVVANVVLLIGLMLGHKWAYILTLVVSLLGVGGAFTRSMGQGVVVLIGNGLVVIPMIVSTSFFFGAARETDPE